MKIREDLKKGLILGLKNRLGIAKILGFMGYQHEVMPIMQSLSHSTRAYVINANSLSGFVAKFDIMKTIRTADERG